MKSPPLNPVRLILKDTSDRRDLQPLRRPRSPLTIEFHLTVSGPGSVPVLIRVDAGTQRRAEQFALAWARSRWFRDARTLEVIITELVD